MKLLKSAVVIGVCAAFSLQSFAQEPNTRVQKAQQDSIDKIRRMESAQDKSVLRQDQRGKPDTGRAVVNPTMRDNTTIDNMDPDDVKQQPPQSNRENAQTQPPGQKQPPHANPRNQDKSLIIGEPPSRTEIKIRSVTTPDGKTIEKEYYRDKEVLRDDSGRRYYMERSQRIYFTDDNKRDDVVPEKKIPDTRDDRTPEQSRPKQ